jgi:hypothetical protein
MLFLDGTVFLALGILAFAVLSGLFKFRKISTQYRWFFYFLVLNLSLQPIYYWQWGGKIFSYIR